MDLFYKIRALYHEGIKIHLHAFDYGRNKPEELKQYCRSIHWYTRKTGLKGLSFTLPYIVKSRSDRSLLANLLADTHPVLLEGIHCTYFLKDLLQHKKKVFVRLHNVESAYYHQLFRFERDVTRKLFYLIESIQLKRYERKLPGDVPLLSIANKDSDFYLKKFNKKNIFYLPAFSPGHEISTQPGMGSFCLYHGNLSVAENEMTALWLLEKVFTKIKLPFVVAGKNPSKRLQKAAHLCQHTCLVANPGEKEMRELVAKAHINVIPSFNDTGIKLKLLMALCYGKHCLVNENTIRDTGLEDACHVGNNADSFASIIAQLYHLPFDEAEISLRKKLMGQHFDNSKNARQLIQLIW